MLLNKRHSISPTPVDELRQNFPVQKYSNVIFFTLTEKCQCFSTPSESKRSKGVEILTPEKPQVGGGGQGAGVGGG